MTIGSTNFPSSVDTASELIQVVNNKGAVLDGGISDSDTSIDVTSAAGIPSDGIAVITDGVNFECIVYGSVSGNTLNSVIRGFSGSSNRAWSDGASIYFDAITAAHHEVLAEAIIAIEDYLLTGIAARWTPAGASGASLEFHEATANGTHKITVKAPDSLSGDWNQTLPHGNGILARIPDMGMIYLGGTTFSGVASFSLNNVFSNNFPNYRVIVNLDSATATNNIGMRMRASGSDHGGNDYARHFRQGTTGNSTVGGTASSGNNWWGLMTALNGDMDGSFIFDIFYPYQSRMTTMHMNGMYLSQATNQYTSVNGGFGMYITNSFDGFSFFLSTSGTMNGRMVAYGYMV